MSQPIASELVRFPVSDTALLQRARTVAPQLRASAAETEANRRPLDRNIQAIEDAGIFRASVPRRFGGDEVKTRTSIDLSAEIAVGCGSTAWATGLSNVCAWIVGLYPERAQAEVFGANPNTRIAGVIAPRAKTTRRVEGGWVISGEWPWGSGSAHAQWAVLGFPMLDAAGQHTGTGLALLPPGDFTTRDTWHSTGMSGSGSNTFVVNEAFVPDYRVLNQDRAIFGEYPTEFKDEALYRAAFVPMLAIILVGPTLGLARAAMEIFLDGLPRRSIIYTWHSKQSEASVTHLQIAQAAMKIDGAHMHAYRAADDIDAAAAAGAYPDPQRRARIRMDCGQAVNLAREAVQLLISASGGSAMGTASPLQRIWRDITTASLHGVLCLSTNEELYGRILVGAEPNTTLL